VHPLCIWTNNVNVGSLAAGVLPAIWAMVSTGGIAARILITLEDSNAGLGGKRPPSTAGETPTATQLR